MTRRACSAVAVSLKTGNELDTSRIDSDLYELLSQTMLAAHVAGEEWARQRLSVVSLSAADDVSKLIRKVPQEQKDAINALYKSMAKASASKTAAAVRNQLLGQVVELSKGKGRKSIRNDFKAAGITPNEAGSSVYKTLLRTQSSLAFNAAAWINTSQNSNVWGYVYVTEQDEKVREAHRILEGSRQPVDSPFWDTYSPPCGWNCRCGLDVIMYGDALARAKKPRRLPEIDSTFKFNAGKIIAK